ncbi:FMRFamide receptor-like [Lycorma delicatula]|uniref:FMRFamide receptor-like n=1 Tax=Lycorma delicatula TaxID=130591 RepID=UPI003F50D842
MENGTNAITSLEDPEGEAVLELLRFWIQRVAVPIVVFIGVVGNSVTVVVLTRRRMSSSTNTYLTALAVADLLYLLFTYYLSFVHLPFLNDETYYWYWLYLPFNLWFTDAMSAVSVWLTVSFTVERYIAVCHPLRGKVLCTEKRARRVIAFVFIFCIITTATTPFEYNVHKELNSGTNKTVINLLNTELSLNKIYQSVFYTYCAAAFVFIPLLLLGFLNFILIKAVRRSRKQRCDLTEVEHCGTSSRQKQENKITMTLISVVFLFMICQTPQAFLLIIKYFYDPSKPHRDYYVLRGLGNIFNFMVAINAASNFMLYCAMSDKYKRTLMLTFFPCLAHRHRRSHTFNSNIASYENSSIRIVTTNS